MLPIEAGELIEVCPVLRVPAAEISALEATRLEEYWFRWGQDAGVALGFGSLYNHSSEPNARYERDLERDVVTVTAVRAIAAGEEITFDYSGPPLE
jgi:SET domain-containing protein